MAAPGVMMEFPVWALLPKRETGVSAFLSKYPEHDGRGIKIAILDSGIDPGAAGLQVTSTGEPKIISMMDASGAGDVDTSKVVEAVDGEITGLTGRQLKIPKSWTNPTGKYHIGVKNAFELYPKQLKERMQRHRKDKFWDSSHKLAQAEAVRKLLEFENKNPGISSQESFVKEDLEAQVDILNSLEKKYNDVGPAYDCVVFHDGKSWKAVLDTTETGDLEKCHLLGPYDETHEYATLTDADMLNYCINVHDDGNLLEIIGQSTGHGTHVASIAAAYFPNEPEKNGVAPGAQLVSVGIGDIRLGSMETGSALVRAMIKVVKSGCQIINMSYGEHAHWSGGRVIDIMYEIVNKHGVIMVVSAGNHGPAISTIGTPPAMYSASVIGVGAYVSPEMMLAEYSMRDVMPGIGYTWTSRGPTSDGDLGVCICAPGGAITSVPNWTLKGSLLMHGTSMSSPHVAGALALLLSGLKAKNLQYSPFSIRRAIENTALKVESWDAFSMGHGLLQVEKAFEHLVQYSDCCERDVRFVISCSPSSTRGIYLREPHDVCKPKTINVCVEPMFLDNSNADPQKKINFHLNLRIICDVPWVSAPSLLSLMFASRTFSIKVDPTGLPYGAHFTALRAYDSLCPEKGPVFHVPITVIRPEKVVDEVNWEVVLRNIALKPNVTHRHFLDVPYGATWAVVKVRSMDPEQNSNVVIHTIQKLPQRSCKFLDFYKNFVLNATAEATFAFPVKERRTLEFCIGKWWCHLGDLNVHYSISFSGLCPSSENINMIAAEGIHRVDLFCPLKYKEVLPSVTFKQQILVLRPTDSKISPLGPRDVIPEGRQIYALHLTYNFSIPKSTEVTPNCPLLGEFLYESEYESQLWMLFDSNKQLLATGDAFPKNYSVKLDKGDYVLHFLVRHEKQSLLEKLTDKPMQICLKLPSAISADVYSSNAEALICGKKFSSTLLSPGTICPVFIASIPHDKLPKGCSPGQYLCGHISYAKESLGKKVDKYPFTYTICDAPCKKATTVKAASSEPEKSLEEEFASSIFDLKVSWVSKLPGKVSLELFEDLAKDSKPIPLLLAKLHALDNDKERTKYVNIIIKLADEITKAIDTTEILTSIVAKNDKRDHNSGGNNCSNNSKNVDKQKSYLIEALVRKGIALCDLLEQAHAEECAPRNDLISKQQATQGETSLADSVSGDTITNGGPAEAEEYTKADTDKVYHELLKWTDVNDTKAGVFFEKHARLHGHHGRALKFLLKQQEEKPTLEVERKCIALYKQLGWTHCITLFERSLPVRYPPSYRLF